MVLGIERKVEIKVIFTGREIGILKDLMEGIYTKCAKLNVPLKVLRPVEEAVRISVKLDSNTAHSLSDEGSIFRKFEILFLVLGRFIRKNSGNLNARGLASDLIYLARLFKDIIERAVREEYDFVKMLAEIVKEMDGIILSMEHSIRRAFRDAA